MVGTVSTPAGLERAARDARTLPFDILEVRCGEAVNEVQTLADAVRAVHAAGKPVLVTVRNRAEGGTWEDDDPARLAWFEAGLRDADAVDVEMSGALAGPVCALAASAGRPVVLSWHDFQRTPPADDLLERMRAAAARAGTTVFKAACRVHTQADISILRAALQARPPGLPVCLIGMGPEGAATRLEFARHGSVLTYGYIDRPSAPGQFSCRTLREFLAVHSPAYRANMVP
ncbi:MAG: type I 3-dehydroquinate dehydratase [Kiritimatiellia bacterium]